MTANWYFWVIVTASLPPAAGVEQDEHAAGDDREIERPAHHGREHDGGRVDGDAGGDAPVEEKQAGAQQAGLLVKPLAEILVSGENFKPAKHRQEDPGDDDHGERRAKVILDETDPALVALAPGWKETWSRSPGWP